jgi:hypothetical protein
MSLVSINPISHGKHNNLHMMVKIGGSRKKPIFKLKLIIFFDTAKAYVADSTIPEPMLFLLDLKMLCQELRGKLDEMDLGCRRP